VSTRDPTTELVKISFERLEPRSEKEAPTTEMPPPRCEFPESSIMLIINEQRDHELIVFGLPKILNNCIETITRVLSSLDVSISTSEIVRAFRIPGRNSSSSLLIVKFATIARRNELITRARRRGGLNASDVCGS
ncbi:hypothetical protein ALC57_17472, partial [Trachymyrmex cornetzi]